MASASIEKQLEALAPFIESGPSEQGEYRIRCPLHGERTASASINPHKDRGVWWCMVCQDGGSLASLVKHVAENADDPMVQAARSANVYSLEGKRRAIDPDAVEELNDGKVAGWHAALMDDEQRLHRLMELRLLSEATIRRRRIGYDRETSRYTVPVFDEAGAVVNVRRYRKVPAGTSGVKWTNAKGHGTPPRLYPIDNLRHNTILICEGELDALAAEERGIPSVSNTHGAKNWQPGWGRLFRGKTVYIAYDNDRDGRVGARRAAANIGKHAKEVHILEPLLPDVQKSDVTDFFSEGFSGEDLLERMQSSQVVAEEPEETPEPLPAVEEDNSVIELTVSQSMVANYNRHVQAMNVTLVGKKDPPFIVPRTIQFECMMDQGNKCKNCPMLNDWEGSHEAVIPPQAVETIAKMIDVRDQALKQEVRSAFGIAKCNGLSIDVEDEYTVEELTVMNDVDAFQPGKADFQMRKVYNVGTSSDTTQTNATARIIGTSIPSPRNQRSEFYAWDLNPTVASIDTFKMTPELAERLKVFQTTGDESPLDKCMDIARDLSVNVTGIIGRERMHVAMDLVWHSALTFNLGDNPVRRGWLELLVVGDTRTGKSEVATRLMGYYKLGQLVNCENASFAGLVGGVNEVQGSRIITWGALTINDRRLCVLDEISGISTDIISQMSDVRSRGIAQVTKIESAVTTARCRAIWVSNPRQGTLERDPLGVDLIGSVIGQPEDIARFDIAMSVRKGDVPSERINNPAGEVAEHKYEQQDCHDLILWVWSRTPDQIVWKPDAYKKVFEVANKLGGMYIDEPPLIQASNVREKVARIAVAFAGRTFSTDDSGECIVVDVEHVRSAANFIHKLYSYDNFGYLEVSQREKNERQTAKASHTSIKRMLEEDVQLRKFLATHNNFRREDLEEFAGMDRVDAMQAIKRLADACMVRKVKSQIVTEPELRLIIKEIEADAAKPRKRSRSNAVRSPR